MPYSPNIGLLEITPGDPAYRNSWGTGLNDGVFGLVDDYTAGQTSKAIGGTGDVVLTYTDGASCEARSSHFIFTGILTGNRTVFWPASHELNFSVSNQTTGAFTLTLAAGSGGVPAGTTQTISNGGVIQNFRSDGTNILQRGGALSNTGVVAGSYTNASLTVGADGRLTAASSGLPPPIILAHGTVATATPNFLSLDLSAYSAYKRIEVQLDGLALSGGTGSDTIAIRFSTDAGANYISTNTYVSYNLDNGSVGTFSPYTAIISGVRMTTVTGMSSLSCDIMGANSAYLGSVRIKGVEGSTGHIIDASGYLPATTNINAIRFFNYSGTNCIAGTYRVIGYV
jgi:hypothetical protein